MTEPDSLDDFLPRHLSTGGTRIGGWSDEWLGVPLESGVYLSKQLPPQALISTARGVVLKGDDVILVCSTPPILVVGGRIEAGETLEEALIREVAEECGWQVRPYGVIGFVHVRHLDGQRPDWGRPAPDWMEVIYSTEALAFDAGLIHRDEVKTELVRQSSVPQRGVGAVNCRLLDQALVVRGNPD